MISCIFNKQKLIVVYIEWMYVKQQQQQQKKEKKKPVKWKTLSLICDRWFNFLVFNPSFSIFSSFPRWSPLSLVNFSFLVNTVDFCTMLISWATRVFEEGEKKQNLSGLLSWRGWLAFSPGPNLGRTGSGVSSHLGPSTVNTALSAHLSALRRQICGLFRKSGNHWELQRLRGYRE